MEDEKASKKDAVVELSHALANVLKEHKVERGHKIAILESLKLDIILNSGMVVLDGTPLKCVCSGCKKEDSENAKC